MEFLRRLLKGVVINSNPPQRDRNPPSRDGNHGWNMSAAHSWMEQGSDKRELWKVLCELQHVETKSKLALDSMNFA
jgi:hypothetical protein